MSLCFHTNLLSEASRGGPSDESSRFCLSLSHLRSSASAAPFHCVYPSVPVLLPLPALWVRIPPHTTPPAGLQAAAGVEVIGEVTASNLSYHASFTQPHTADPTGHAAGGGGNLDGVLNFPAYYRALPRRLGAPRPVDPQKSPPAICFCDLQSAICNLQSAICDLQSAICHDMQTCSRSACLPSLLLTRLLRPTTPAHRAGARLLRRRLGGGRALRGGAARRRRRGRPGLRAAARRLPSDGGRADGAGDHRARDLVERQNEAGWADRPAADWPRMAEAWGRPGLDSATAGAASWRHVEAALAELSARRGAVLNKAALSSTSLALLSPKNAGTRASTCLASSPTTTTSTASPPSAAPTARGATGRSEWSRLCGRQLWTIGPKQLKAWGCPPGIGLTRTFAAVVTMQARKRARLRAAGARRAHRLQRHRAGAHGRARFGQKKYRLKALGCPQQKR